MNDTRPNAMTVFGEALECETAAERSALLERACGGDPDLRANVEALLEAHQAAGNFLRGRSTPRGLITKTAEPASELTGTVIGAYKLLQQIGEGGFGIVYMADQEHPVRRRVALKIIKPGMDSEQVIARFEAERQALAMMNHQNIARVYDTGTTPAGRPYFVMELVHGIPITKYCDENHLSPRERLELFIPICQAIQHAHQKGIIHRDVKPSNVLVTLYDGKPVPKVIDFGVAKAMEQRLTDRTMFTQYGTVVGTFEYMAPEQAEMSALGVDTRSDIYSLGVLLYELLTGTTPLDRTRVREAVYSEVVRLIKEEEPPKPSTRISKSGSLPAIAAARKTEPTRLARLVRGELDWIVMKCLEKDRARRYETANALVRDVQRFLADEPVEACPHSAGYKFMKFSRKYRKALVIAGAFVLVLALATVFSAVQAVRATLAKSQVQHERDSASKARAQAEAVSRFLTEDLLLQAEPEQNEFGKQVTVVQMLRKAAKKIESTSRFADEPELEATLRSVIGNTLDKLGEPKEAGPHLRRAAELRLSALGPDNLDTLTAQEDLAYFLISNGDPEKAETLARQTYVARDRVLGPDNPKTLESLDTLCGALVRLGRYPEAEPLHRKCLAGRQQVRGDKHKETLQSMNNLGVALYEQGRHAEAEPLLLRCVQYSIESQGPKNPETFAPRSNLGLVQLAMGKFVEAERTLRDAIIVSRDVTDPKSAKTLHFQHVLVRILTGAEKLDDAERVGRETLAARREILTPGHPDIGRSLVALSLALVFEGKYADAEPFLREALEICREQPNMDDWIAQSEMSRGTALIALGRAAEAQPLLAKAWPKYAADGRILAWQKQRTAETVAAVYEKAGNKTEAAAWRAKVASAPGN